MTTRAAGFYWVQWQSATGETFQVHPPMIAYWSERSWSGCGGDQDTWDDSDPDWPGNRHVVLAGPLQAPTFLPTGAVVYDNRLLTDGDVARMYHARLRDLRSSARALLEGTTPGPWDDRSFISVEDLAGRFGGPHDVRDAKFILGAHALLTDLAKEGM